VVEIGDDVTVVARESAQTRARIGQPQKHHRTSVSVQRERLLLSTCLLLIWTLPAV
jgi:hypothetical protein